MEEYTKGKQSSHFYSCIHSFFESISQEEKVDIIKILIENDTILLAVMMTDQLESKKTINLNQVNKDSIHIKILVAYNYEANPNHLTHKVYLTINR